MGMVVRTNIMAMNANRNLNKNNSSVSKDLEKLSSGFRINRAADDASGLAISEKMKAQIKALDTASANAQDGISLIQTAEGYMGEVHDMLNRIVELAEKSANGTYETVDKGTAAETFGAAGVDRQALQDEVDQLCAEIDRIATTANFNQLKLMDGTMDGTTGYSKITAITADEVAEDTGVITAATITPATVTAAEGAALKLQIGETSGAADKLEVNIRSFKTDYLFAKLATAGADDDGKVAVGAGAKAGEVSLLAKNAESENTKGLTINISNQDSASLAAEAVRDVIDEVSTQRATLGAMQNRLDYTINNLDTASENISSANSRIRDTDMAKTMMKYTQGNVLTQAAQAMLAQANQQTQGVLQLLQ